ncbi:MAG: hypothetical protein Q9183_001399 [Haloplaca sp. 2 TL-2023]
MESDMESSMLHVSQSDSWGPDDQENYTQPEKTSSVEQAGSFVELAHNDITILVPPVTNRWQYRVYRSELEIASILEEYEDLDELQYLVRFSDGHKSEVSFTQLNELANGPAALDIFNSQMSDARSQSTSSSDEMVTTRTTRGARTRDAGFTDFKHVILSSEDELTTGRSTRRSNRKSSKQRANSSSLDPQPRRRQASRRAIQPTSYKIDMELDESDNESDSDAPVLGKRKRKRSYPTSIQKANSSAARRSDRSGRGLRSMHEIGEDYIPEVATAQTATKAIGAKESFRRLPSNDEFKGRHLQKCDTCDYEGDDEEKGILISCQGCTMSYHQKCLGPRNSRDHLVTKIADQDFVLQCRRCIGTARQKDPMAPDQAQCAHCHHATPASVPFRERKSTSQEQKDREANGGEDPSTNVASSTINNADNVLFRCLSCFRAFHFDHLPAREEDAIIKDISPRELADDRFSEYCRFGEWTCRECSLAPAKVDSLIAWRPLDQNNYASGTPTQAVKEDDKEYLVRWEKRSYSKSTWMPGAWVWGVTKHSMRYAFASRENGRNMPRMKFEDAVPEEWLRVDIVLDVKYTSLVKVQVEEVDMKRVKEVKSAYVKFKGLGYEDVVWDEPPDILDTDRWADFYTAYKDWVRAKYIHHPNNVPLNNRLAKLRSRDFEANLELKSQPELLVGGELMPYQLEGTNWLYYQWHRQQNAILADEMGLGKTVQVITFLLTLQQAHNCWPALVVVPNSTCANWRREIKQWAPSLRVVTYFGSSDARRLSKRYELFPRQDNDLSCHVVVTSYDAAQDSEFRKVFRKVSWQALVVDEGQRLKNDKNLLYHSLGAMKVPFKVLLTGTPLQNNARELFNLLQFLDTAIDAAQLEEEYTELTKDNVRRLHDMLRPFFLRRTKAQVLTFLPAMAQIIVPVTLTVLQKKLYKSILARNPDLLKAVFGGTKRALAKTDRASLNNILMQLRKCLCHPFVYNREIEERSSNTMVLHRNLVEASSKLQLLEVMLPKLQERGHRVLIFSQFLNMLDMVEDFLDGLGLFYQRLDGSMGSLQKQKRIDEFNAPDSRLFAFLLSTRAGGVGINLATADTVIILDPDFNPHQDIQALSRAHRIGQKKKVLVFQLVTRSTAEEKIMQIGKKKMALDHALIEQLDANEEESVDVESILRFGTEALFQDDDTNDVRYDSASVDKLLDRSQMENTDIAKDQSAESQFSYARVWANDKGMLEDGLDDESDSGAAPDPSLWENILREREADVAREAAERAEMLGRGKRQRQTVDYANQAGQAEPALMDTPEKSKGQTAAEGSDTDFESNAAESEDEEESDADGEQDQDLAKELAEKGGRGSRSQYVDRTFKRVHVPQSDGVMAYPGMEQPFSMFPAKPPVQPAAQPSNSLVESKRPEVGHCVACNSSHAKGSCPIKTAGVEYCPLCGQAHFASGFRKVCAHLHSLEQCLAMLEALKESDAPREEKEVVKKYLVGIVGNLRHDKKVEQQKRERQQQQQSSSHPAAQHTNGVQPTGSIPEQVNGTGHSGHRQSVDLTQD